MEQRVAEVFRQLAPSGEIEREECVPILMAAAPMLVDCTVSLEAILAALEEKLSGSGSKPLGLCEFFQILQSALRRDFENDMNRGRILEVEKPTSAGDVDVEEADMSLGVEESILNEDVRTWDEAFRRVVPARVIQVEESVPILKALASWRNIDVSPEAIEKAVEEMRPDFPHPIHRDEAEHIIMYKAP